LKNRQLKITGAKPNQIIVSINLTRSLQPLAESRQINSRRPRRTDLDRIPAAHYSGNLTVVCIQAFVMVQSASWAIRRRHSQTDSPPFVAPNVELHQRAVQIFRVSGQKF